MSMRPRLFILGTSILLAALAVWWLTSRPQLNIALAADYGKGSLTYRCTITTDAAEAEGRAKAAHQAVMARIVVLNNESYTAFMAQASKPGGLDSPPDVGPFLAQSKAEFHAAMIVLQSEIKTKFDCRVDL